MTQIINLLGAPGTGKSTNAAGLFYELKTQNKKTEYIQEYVKDWAYEERKIDSYDQIYFLAKQIRKETLLFNKVDYVITDSPVIMNQVYTKKYCSEYLYNAVKYATEYYYKQSAADGHKHINILLKRIKPYQQVGRYQTEEESDELFIDIKNLLVELNVEFYECNADKNEIMKFLKEKEII